MRVYKEFLCIKDNINGREKYRIKECKSYANKKENIYEWERHKKDLVEQVSKYLAKYEHM